MEKDDKGSTLIRIGVSGESSFWYRPTRVVPDQRPLNGRCTEFSLCMHIHVPSCKISHLVGFCPGSTTFLTDWPTKALIR